MNADLSRLTGNRSGRCKPGAGFVAAVLAGLLWFVSTCSVAASISTALSFNVGWNLAGNSLTTPIDVKATFGDQSAIQSVWRWETAAAKWSFYAPALDGAGTLASYAANTGYSVLATIGPGQGYWVNTSTAIALGTRSGTGFALAAANLTAGWNLVATGDDVVASSLASSLGNVTTLWAWDNSTGVWYFHAPSLADANTQSSYIQSKGYLEFGSLSLGQDRGFWVNYAGTSTPPTVSTFTPLFVRIPGGSFVMGDHSNFVDPDHPSDEVPLHNVTISPFFMSTTLVTNQEYRDYLNAALAAGLIEVRGGMVYGKGGSEIYLYTTTAVPLSTINFSNNVFAVRSGRELHPVTGIRWFGAAAYANWLSARDGYTPCYNLATGTCDLTKNGYRLPTEAEWEYAARGGQTNPYYQFPWGNDTNADGRLSNWQGSGDPWENGAYPHTTPVGFYNGSLRNKSDYDWPDAVTTYQTRDGSNAFGLHDMAGNVWEWVNDWYSSTYYQYCVSNNITVDPPGPDTGTVTMAAWPTAACAAAPGGTAAGSSSWVTAASPTAIPRGHWAARRTAIRIQPGSRSDSVSCGPTRSVARSA